MIKPNYWQGKIQRENANYKEWEGLFLCRQLEDYWEGRQWRTLGISRTSYKPYMLNMIYATLKIKLANIIFQRPQFLVAPKPGHANWDLEMAYRSASIKESALNTVCLHPKIHFVDNIRFAALDSFLRGFGIVEVGYAADWTNPNKTPLVTNVDEDPELDNKIPLDKLKVTEDEEVPVNERFFVRHIKARRFRACCPDLPILDYSDWCGYYSFIRKSVLAKTKGIDLPKELKSEYYSIGASDRYIKREQNSSNPDAYLESNAYFKVWRLWDNVRKVRELVVEDQGWPVIFSDKFDRLPFPNVHWDDRAPSKEDVGFYPMPPVFQWISSQDEINQSREQFKIYRKRDTRKFWVNDYVKDDEVQKLSNNVDGEVVRIKGKIPGEQAMGILQNPEAGPTITNSLESSISDLNIVTGTSANARQQTDRTTATESKIIDMRAQIRESIEQLDFSQFVTDIGREGLLTIHERFTEGMWVKTTVGPSGNWMEEYQDAQIVYQYLSNQEITDGSYDWDITLDVMNGTPEQMQQEQQKFFMFMQIVMGNPQIALSPILLRETAAKIGYKNERVIREFQKAAALKMLQQGQMAQAAANSTGLGNGNNGSGISMDQNTMPPQLAQIMSNLRQQLGR